MDNIHINVKKSKIDITLLTQIIQFPELGKNFTKSGNAAITKYGNDMPRLIKKNVNINKNEFCVKAKATAVPTKGAEHGVAIKVAKKPVIKSENNVLFDDPNIFKFGEGISNKPIKLKENNKRINAIVIKNNGY